MENQQIFNVAEGATLYDTILCGADIPGLYPSCQFFATMAALANANELSFFNTRNQSMSHKSITNMDAIDRFSFPFLIDSIGVQPFVLAPIGRTPEHGGEVPVEQLTDEQSIILGPLYWMTEFLKHCSVTVKINQDEKLVTMADMLPAGFGLSGSATSDPLWNQNNFTQSGILVYSNGRTHIKNRIPMPKPLEVPRGQTVTVSIVPSTKARNDLRVLSPGFANSRDFENSEVIGQQINGFVGLRVSLMGTRFVQQRGQLHY